MSIFVSGHKLRLTAGRAFRCPLLENQLAGLRALFLILRLICHCHCRRRWIKRRQEIYFRQESPSTPRRPLHSYGFSNKSLCERERNSSSLSRKFGKNLSMNTQTTWSVCRQLEAKLDANFCCHATHANWVKVLRTRSTVDGQISRQCTRKCFNVRKFGESFLWLMG